MSPRVRIDVGGKIVPIERLKEGVAGSIDLIYLRERHSCPRG